MQEIRTNTVNMASRGLILRNMHVFMDLEGYFPVRISLDIFNNFRNDSTEPAPFRLKEEPASVSDQFPVFFSPFKIILVFNNYFSIHQPSGKSCRPEACSFLVKDKSSPIVPLKG